MNFLNYFREDEVGQRIVWFAFVFALTLISLVVFKREVKAHTFIWPDGQTYDFSKDGCCQGWECGPVEVGAIREVKGGYEVDFRRDAGSPARNRRYKEFVPYNSYKIRANPFSDREMACISSSPRSVPKAGEEVTYQVRCIYPIQPQT